MLVDQTYDSLGFLHFRESELDKTHFLKVSGRILNSDEISSSDTFLNVLCLVTKIECYKGAGKKLIFEHSIHENSPQLITVLAVKVSRCKAYRGPLLRNESYTFILDSGDWVKDYLPINNAPLTPEFKCSTKRLQVYDPNFVPIEPMKKQKKKTSFFNQGGRSRGRPNQWVPNRLNHGQTGHQGHQSHQNQSGHQGHQDHPGHQGHQGPLAQQGHLGQGYQGHHMHIPHQQNHQGSFGWNPQLNQQGWSFQQSCQQGWGSTSTPYPWGSPPRQTEWPTNVILPNITYKYHM